MVRETVPDGFKDEQLFNCHDFVFKRAESEVNFSNNVFPDCDRVWRTYNYENLSQSERLMMQRISYSPLWWGYGENYSIEAIRTLTDVLSTTHSFTPFRELKAITNADHSVIELKITHQLGKAHLRLTRVNDDDNWSIEVVDIEDGELHEVMLPSSFDTH